MFVDRYNVQVSGWVCTKNDLDRFDTVKAKNVGYGIVLFVEYLSEEEMIKITQKKEDEVELK